MYGANQQTNPFAIQAAEEEELIDRAPPKIRGASSAPVKNVAVPATFDELAVIVDAMPDRLKLLIVLAAFISPFRAERRMVREMLSDGAFVEIFVDVPLEEAERRDPKGLYAKARSGAIPNFTGIGSPYEPPESPEIRIDSVAMDADQAADEIIRSLGL